MDHFSAYAELNRQPQSVIPFAVRVIYLSNILILKQKENQHAGPECPANQKNCVPSTRNVFHYEEKSLNYLVKLKKRVGLKGNVLFSH